MIIKKKKNTKIINITFKKKNILIKRRQLDIKITYQKKLKKINF